MEGQLPTRRQRTILVSAALLASAVYLLVHPTAGRSADEPRPSARAPSAAGTFRPTKEEWAGLAVEPVQTRVFQPSASAEGNIAIDDDLTTPVFSPYSGRVVRLIAKLGDEVEQGAPLVAVEATEIVQAHNDLIAAGATLKTAKSQLTMAQTNEQRQHELYLAKGGALKDWQQSRTELAAAQNAARSAEAAVTAVRNRLRILGKSEAESRAIEASPSAAIDPVAIVRAPIAGIVTQRQVGLGQNIESVSAGAGSPIYTIGNLSKVWMVAHVREADAPKVRLGMPVEVSVAAFPGRAFSAEISWIAPGIDTNTHRLAVRADVANPDGSLKPQMFARFRIMTGIAAEHPTVPQAAVVYEGDTSRVWVVGENGSLNAREIRIGQIRDHMVEVLAGISAGDTVVTSGSLFLDQAAKGD